MDTQQEVGQVCQMEIKVARLEAHPTEDESFIVGFDVRCCANDKTRHFTALVTTAALPDQFDDEDIAQAAWGSVAAEAQAWLDGVKDRSHVVGSAFVPRSV